MILPNNFYIAILLTFLAGIATFIGGCLTFFIKKDNMKVLSVGLGFSAGVMIFLSFTEILQQAQELLEVSFPSIAKWLVILGFSAGILVAVLIDYFIPDHIEDEMFETETEAEKKILHKEHRIKRAGIFTAIAIAIHNLPEGMTTFFITTQDVTLGISVAIAIALHNIPEGISVALPIYHATGKKRTAIGYAILSGISEPIGALLALFLFQLFVPEIFVGVLCALVAGIMIYISFDTLLPLSKEYGNWHLSITGIITGILVIWTSLLLLE